MSDEKQENAPGTVADAMKSLERVTSSLEAAANRAIGFYQEVAVEPGGPEGSLCKDTVTRSNLAADLQTQIMALEEVASRLDDFAQRCDL